MKTVRIFISSPQDVAEERQRAQEVIEQLQRWYGADRVRLEPVRWEDLPLPAATSFQQGIEALVTKGGGVDVAVFILWNRLGSPLGAALKRADGTEYRSGTEREFELMLAATEASGGRPALLAYVRDDDRGFLRLLEGRSASEREADWEQSRAVRAFVQERFRDEQGHNLRAYHSFEGPVTFARRFKVHLRAVIDELLAVDAPRAGSWTRPPFRGLEPFGQEDAPIFFGREREVLEVQEALLRRTQQGEPAFVCIVGASGAGKSSLARAGVAASLAEGAEGWRVATFLPRDSDGLLAEGVGRSLWAAVPELEKRGGTRREFCEALARDPTLAITLALRPALGAARVLLVVDQLEEAFTSAHVTPEARERFWRALDALARSGLVWVVSTLRSDFYAVAQRDPGYVALKGAGGHFDLLAPSHEGLASLIAQPAAMAGLRFERDGEASLEARLLKDALEQPEALPLLEYVLLELYERRTPEGVLTLAAYDELGGVSGAIGRRAEATLARLGSPARDALGRLLRQLAAAGDDGAVVARSAPRSSFPAGSAEDSLLAALLAERLVLIEGDGERVHVRVTHEALLSRWPRAKELIEGDRARLVARRRLEEAFERWTAAGRPFDLLLPEGLPLQEAEALIEAWGAELPEQQRAFVAASRRRVSVRTLRARASVAAAFLALLLLAGWAWLERGTAQTYAAQAEQKRGEAEAARAEADRLRVEADQQKAAALQSREKALVMAVELFNEFARVPYDSVSSLSPETLSLLTRVVEQLRDSGKRIVIEGHLGSWCELGPGVLAPETTDVRHCREMTEEYALVLGQKRAQALRRLAANLGGDEKAIDTISYGSNRPLVEYPTKGTAKDWNEAAAANNRLVIRFQ